jgi:DNA-binding CsgD family transcriptional regulator
VTYPRSNSDLALQLIGQFKGLIDGISYKMAVRYHLSEQDREDLISSATAKLATIQWHKQWRRARRTWKPTVKGKKMPPPSLNNYVVSTIQTWMSKELRRIKAEGLSGLSKGPPIGAFPAHDDTPQLERGMDGLPDKLAAHQIALLATQVLTADEQTVIALRFAFDGGPDRTEMQIARELDMSRAKVANLVESAMAKLRRAVGR